MTLRKCNFHIGAGAGSIARMNASPEPIRPARAGAKSIVVLCVLVHAAMTGSRVAMSLAALALGATTLQVGLLLALHALVPALGAVGLGRWIDRTGPRIPALAGMVAVCAGLALAARWPCVAVLWTTAALVGGGHAAAALALQNQLGRLGTPADARGGFATFALGTAVSGSVGPALAGECLARHGAGPTFAVLAGIALTALLAAGAMRHRLPHGDGQGASAARAGASVREILADAGLRRILAADLLMAIAWNANSVVVPLHGRRHGWSAAIVGDLLGTFGAAVLLVRAMPAAWRRRVGDWRAIRWALASSGACFLALPFADRLPWPFLLEAVMGLGLGGALASVLALLHAQAPPHHGGAVLGLRLVVLNVSAIALPLGLGATSGLAGCIALLGAGLALGAAGLRPVAGR